MEESFGAVKQNKVSIIHWLIVFFMMFGGLGPVVYQLVFQPMINLADTNVLLMMALNSLLFVAGLGAWNFKKWGCLLGLSVSTIAVLIRIVNFGSILNTLSYVPLTFKTLASGGYFPTNFMIFINEIAPLISFIIFISIFFYLLIKRKSFSK